MVNGAGAIPPNDFVIPPGARMSAVAAAKTALWQASDNFARAHLLPALCQVEYDGQIAAEKRGLLLNYTWCCHRVMRKIQQYYAKRAPHYAGDVLVVVDTEGQLSPAPLICLMVAIARSGRKVLCIVDGNSPECADITAAAREAEVGERVQCIDPLIAGRNFLECSARQLEALYHGMRDYKWLCRKLAPTMRFPFDYLYLDIYQASIYRLVWEALEPSLKYDAAIVRHQYLLSSNAAARALAQGKLVVSIQDKMILTPQDFLPLLAHRFVCFGEVSRNLIAASSADFARRTGKPATCRDFLQAGWLFEQPKASADPAAHRTILALAPSPDKTNAYGYGREAEIFWQTIEDLLLNAGSADHLLFRQQPGRELPERLLQWKQQYPERVEIAHSSSTLRQNLAQTSIAVGIYDSALITAAAAGIPAFFLWEPGWFYTPEMRPFQQDFLISPEHLTARINDLMSNPTKYAQLQERARAAAGQYLDWGEKEPSPEFIERLLAR